MCNSHALHAEEQAVVVAAGTTVAKIESASDSQTCKASAGLQLVPRRLVAHACRKDHPSMSLSPHLVARALELEEEGRRLGRVSSVNLKRGQGTLVSACGAGERAQTDRDCRQAAQKLALCDGHPLCEAARAAQGVGGAAAEDDQRQMTLRCSPRATRFTDEGVATVYPTGLDPAFAQAASASTAATVPIMADPGATGLAFAELQTSVRWPSAEL